MKYSVRYYSFTRKMFFSISFFCICFLLLYPNYSNGQGWNQSPINRCTKNSFLVLKRISCNVTSDNLKINDVIINRGNCPSLSQSISSASTFCEDRGSAKTACVAILSQRAQIEKQFMFGDQISFYTTCSNPIEVVFQTNRGSWQQVVE